MPEAKLAREAELCYSTIAMMTDFDFWHPDHVSVADVVRVMHANSANAKQQQLHAIPRIGADAGPCLHGCDRALEYAMLTPTEMRDPELVHRFDAVAGRVLRGGVAS
jgi:5'-methylthioadenosine phosphorylase